MATDHRAAELQLIHALKNKEPLGIKILYDRYSPALLTTISQIVKDEEPADILQVVMVKIWNTAMLYDHEKGHLFTWMHHIARNCALDVLRSKAYRAKSKHQCIDDCVELLEKRSNITFNPDTIGLRHMVNRLEPKLSEVINLVYFNGLTHMEAAEELNMKLGTVKTRIRSAIAEIRKEFQD